MAIISNSDRAPEGRVHYSLGQVSFDLEGSSDFYETEDRSVIGCAATHPWLVVTEANAPEQDEVVVAPTEPSYFDEGDDYKENDE